ncbi:RDD family protein [Massilia glaciei]|uniref:RDD family protein n=1 Tax=Massilia glaciei TaxID=1524097 RepID=UPI0015E80B4F|nr:RDD family protein [Massilia glaciei]
MLDGRLSLTTPEGVRLLLTPAGPYLRAGAWALDFALWVIFMVGVRAVLPFSKLFDGLFLLLLFLSYWGYPIVCEVLWHGQTLGKRAAGIAVLRADGLPVRVRESALRNLLLVADFMPMFYLSGLACMLIDPRFRRLGDIVAGTQVVHVEKPRKRRPAVAAEPLALPFALSLAEQRTLADLFEREHGLPAERMDELGTLAAPLTGCEGGASIERMRRYAAGLAH